jgi:sterol desaturase/sphingolipid hydroxylase (fatty acid hydroxylase superfamily)
VIHFFWDRILGTYRRPDVRRAEPVHGEFVNSRTNASIRAVL